MRHATSRVVVQCIENDDGIRTSPSLVGMVEAVALDVEISGDWAFVATGDDELLAVDIRDPEKCSMDKAFKLPNPQLCGG